MQTLAGIGAVASQTILAFFPEVGHIPSSAAAMQAQHDALEVSATYLALEARAASDAATKFAEEVSTNPTSPIQPPLAVEKRLL